MCNVTLFFLQCFWFQRSEMLICHLGLLQNVECSVYNKLDYHRHLFGKYFVFIKFLFLIDDLFISIWFWQKQSVYIEDWNMQDILHFNFFSFQDKVNSFSLSVTTFYHKINNSIVYSRSYFFMLSHVVVLWK